MAEMSKSEELRGSEKEHKALMESYWGRIPESQRVTPLRMAWQDLWAKGFKYLPKEDMMAVGEAFVFSSEAHGDQRRYSGDPYIVHTVSVAGILAGMEIDRETLVAALLHDVLEDTKVVTEELEKKFGSGVVTLVDGVTKLGKLPFSTVEDYQAENLRKMFIVMAKDIRVVLIKLADRLHNMRTISSHRREKQISIAHETLEIYAPLAHRLGIYQVKRELEDLSFRILDPEMYYDIKRRVRKKLPEREHIIKQAIDILTKKVHEEGLNISIKGRPKHFYSIFEKMRRKNLSLDQLYDLLALRVVVNTIAECYQVLGLVHTIWKPIPGQFDDYIANPKSNMYQSLHTTVVGPAGEPLEVQIRTWEMHYLAEYGIAAHWNYKEGGHKVDNLDKGLTWIRKALEASPEGQEEEEPTQFLDNLKTDVLTSEVFVFTPKGQVISVPNGSTPIDFAYAIHTEIGHKCVGAMVNGRIAPMDQALHNGDIVRILTSPQGKPSRDWLKIAKSNRTRSKIKAWFRQHDRQEREEKIKRGKELLEKEAVRRGLGKGDAPLDDISSQLSHIAHDMGYLSLEELIVSVGNGSHTASNILARVSASAPKEQKDAIPEPGVSARKEADSEIIVDGAPGVLVSLAQCCKPVPGDPIEGGVTQSRGITVHRKDCPNLEKIDPGKHVQVSWGKPKDTRYTARIKVEGVDRQGLLSDIVQGITLMDGLLTGVRANVVNNTRTRIIAEVQVKDLEHLYRIIAKLNAISGVIEITRG
ncbi:bifunctional (p)ppGpp synthetase/guanosine-3',5'-bis(diphosphate) 3'-pyrophosphohydrolase [Synergistaceae bacterium OttesenSCG-928-D05]|nr:bifunctional (p)ppGpp synthetase/guanosine-3',5'-bis(diphosphate) 3'-pyrophosphohydrolase [Synergistaceae bacterium OttesenSCG-928-D05]